MNETVHHVYHQLTKSADTVSAAAISILIMLLYCSMHLVELLFEAQFVLLVHNERPPNLRIAQLAHSLFKGAQDRLLACPFMLGR